MALIVVLASLIFLMLAAHRGHSVILAAPIAALGAVMLTGPSAVLRPCRSTSSPQPTPLESPSRLCIAWSRWRAAGWIPYPHNGAVITLLAVTGLTHRQSYRDIFAITLIKSLAALFVIAMFHLTRL